MQVREPKVDKVNAHYFEKRTYKLKELSEHLPSLYKHTRKKSVQKADTSLADLITESIKAKNARLGKDEQIQSEDVLFEATRHHLYRKAYQEGNSESITEEYVFALLEVENSLLTRPRAPSSVKGKARRMSEYMQNEFVIFNKYSGRNGKYKDWTKEQRAEYMREYMREYRKNRKEQEDMTRKERAISNSKARAEKSKKRVLNLTTGMFAEDYKKKSGKWDITKIAKDANVSRDTVYKYAPVIL